MESFSEEKSEEVKKTGKRCFYIDFDKLDAILKEKGMSRADLTQFFDHDRGWLTQVKNRGESIDDYTAEAIRKHLGCGAIQEFGQEKSGYHSPVTFNEVKYMEKSEELFGELNKKRGEDLYAILKFLKEDTQGFEYLLASIRMRETGSNSNQFVGSEWIRVLYISELAKEMGKRLKEELKLKDHGSCEEQDIRDRFNRLKKNTGNEDSVKWFDHVSFLERIVHKRLTKPMERLLEHLLETTEVGGEKSEFDKMAEAVENRCASFVLNVFDGLSGDISRKEQKKIYEQGFLF